MANVLSFPHYVPKNHLLRSYLLFYDDVFTIVPYEDQFKVEQRRPVKELRSIAQKPVLKFINPNWTYSKWFNQDISQSTFKQLIKKAESDPRNKYIRENIQVDANGYIKNSIEFEKLVLSQGWNYLARQKFPNDLLHQLFNKKLAFQASLHPYEYSPILIEPRLCEFVISRLARQISIAKHLSPISPTKRQIDDLILDGEISTKDKNSRLLAVALEVGIPQNINTLRIGDYWALREEFSGVRVKLNNLINELLIQHGLDQESDATAFRDMVSDFASDIEKQIISAQKQQKQVIWQKRKTIAIDIIASAAGGAVGSAIGGIPGASLGVFIGKVISKFATNISTRANIASSDSQLIENIAVIRSAITRQARIDSYKRPNYYL
jgi:hypothetical protein